MNIKVDEVRKLFISMHELYCLFTVGQLIINLKNSVNETKLKQVESNVTSFFGEAFPSFTKFIANSISYLVFFSKMMYITLF